MENNEFKLCLAEAQKALENHGSIIVRKSGTEPVLRLKIEDKDALIVSKVSETILDCIKKIAMI